jgi:hypothetical protein
MAWGGSLNRQGSDHIRKLREADKVIGFLENFKKDLNPTDREYLKKTIEIITDYMTQISESKK